MSATFRASCIALVVVLAGCSTQPRQEATALLCSDGDDNDGDTLSDCSDPDCQAYDRCRDLRGDAMVSLPSDGGQTLPPMPFDASGGIGARGASGSGGRGGAGGDLDEDAGWLPPAVLPDAAALPCQGMCASTQACIDDRCEEVSAPTSGTFELLILSATLPDRDFTTRCFDIDCGGAPYAVCRCSPDPYVRAVRVREGDAQEVGITSAVTDNPEPTFSDPPFTIGLEPGDALHLEVWDFDPQPALDEPIYECTADLRMLMGGPIECSTVVLLGLPPYRVSAELRPLP